MAALSSGPKRLVVVVATGMVGGYAVRYALEHPAVGRLTVIGRKKLGISNPKLREVLHRDFADCSALMETLSGRDAVIFCLGTLLNRIRLPAARGFHPHRKTTNDLAAVTPVSEALRSNN